MKKQVRIIAEIGTGHGGELRRARRLIRAARDAGATFAKFQLVYADEILHPRTGTVPLPGGDIPLYETFSRLERPIDYYAELRNLCADAGIEFLCTPFGIRSARELRDIGASSLKIASPELNFTQLLEEVAGFRLPLIISSGVSLLSDIEEAITTIRQVWNGTGADSSGSDVPSITLLHCVTAYPAPEGEYNLRILPALSSLFAVETGVSDHSLDPLIVPTLATALGASTIEKHITLNRSDAGLDDPVALEPGAFARMVAAVRSAEAAGPDATIEAAKRKWGSDRVEKVLGTGRKQLSESEKANYGRTNRSIHACNHLSAGTVIETGDVAILRTEKVLRPGLHPRHLRNVIGSRVQRDVESGQGIVWDDLLNRENHH